MLAHLVEQVRDIVVCNQLAACCAGLQRGPGRGIHLLLRRLECRAQDARELEHYARADLSLDEDLTVV